jgi:hypothetical protein
MNDTAQRHPTGLAGALTTIVVVIAAKSGVELSPTEAALIVGAITTIVSYFTPR